MENGCDPSETKGFKSLQNLEIENPNNIYERSDNMNLSEIKDVMAKQIYGKTITEAQAEMKCIQCGDNALDKCYSQAGRNEFDISGLCEECFDKIMEG